MAYTTLETIDDIGLREILNFPNLDTPMFYPIMLFVIFTIFTTLTFFKEVKREGKGNILSSLAVGGYVTTAISAIFSLLGLISTVIAVTTLVITIVFQAMYLISGD